MRSAMRFTAEIAETAEDRLSTTDSLFPSRRRPGKCWPPEIASQAVFTAEIAETAEHRLLND